MIYEEFDDLVILSNDLTAAPGLTLCGLVRDEMYFLPAFLAHYRSLGVERFILLDDRSEDGTRAYLAAQPDVMLLGSDRRFGEEVVPEEGPRAGRPTRMVHIWRSLLMRRFCTDRWALQMDADEFVALPAGWGLAHLVARAEAGPGRAVTGIMLDTYPARITDLKADGPFDPAAGWHVDGRRHAVWAAHGRGFGMDYPGVRARLMYQWGLVRPGLRETVRRLLRRRHLYLNFNLTTKIFLMKWEASAVSTNSHSTTLAVIPNLLLPLLHFKFTPDLQRRMAAALAERQHYKGSVEYERLQELVTRMQASGASFLCRHSHPAWDIEALRRNGNLLLG